MRPPWGPVTTPQRAWARRALKATRRARPWRSLKGAPGVINAFCKGPAKVTVTIDGKPPHSLTGGTCGRRANGDFTLNLGVLGTRDLAGPRPDYVGLKAPIGQGAFDSGALIVNVDGKSYIVTTNHGAVGPGGGSFAGVTRRGHKVTGAFTC